MTVFAYLSRRGPHPRMAARNAGARVAAGQDRPAATTMNSRRRTIPTPRLLPHIIQLCIHCRHNPAGFWVSRNGDQTVRRPSRAANLWRLDADRMSTAVAHFAPGVRVIDYDADQVTGPPPATTPQIPHVTAPSEPPPRPQP